MKMKLPDAVYLPGNAENGGQTKNPNDFLRGMDAAVLAFLRMIAVFFGIKFKDEPDSADKDDIFIPKSRRRKRKYCFYTTPAASGFDTTGIKFSAGLLLADFPRQCAFA